MCVCALFACVYVCHAKYIHQRIIGTDHQSIHNLCMYIYCIHLYYYVYLSCTLFTCLHFLLTYFFINPSSETSGGKKGQILCWPIKSILILILQTYTLIICIYTSTHTQMQRQHSLPCVGQSWCKVSLPSGWRRRFPNTNNNRTVTNNNNINNNN